jgi:hypothetical protein
MEDGRYVFCERKIKYFNSPGSVVYVGVSFPPATKETGAMGREIVSRQGLHTQGGSN